MNLNLNIPRRRMILVALCVALLLLVLPPAVSADVRLTIASVFEPVTSMFRDAGLGIRARLESFGRGTKLQRELEDERQAHAQTREQLAAAKDEHDRILRAVEEQKALRAALERVQWRRGVPIPANVIRRPGLWENCVLSVDVGSDKGVVRRQAVLAGESALGVVSDVSGSSSRVLMLGHPDLVIPAMIVETRQQGMVEASGGRLELKFITHDQQVRPGYQVVTSGLDGFFPPGCLIGKVAPGVARGQDQPFYKIFIDQTRATASPETVWILTGMEPDDKPDKTDKPGPRRGPDAGRRPAEAAPREREASPRPGTGTGTGTGGTGGATGAGRRPPG